MMDNYKKIDITVLYAEDDKDTRVMISDILRLKIENVIVAKDGEEALELFKTNKIHLVISDYNMPKMNGNELCDAIKKIDKLVSFVLLTAHNDTSLLIGAIDAGVDKFLNKPIKADKLFGVIDRVYKDIEDKGIVLWKNS